jgi:crossover junction endodeoxyribonuclease RusA
MSANTTQEATRLTLSWPAPGLNPNSRLHWSRKSRLVKTARQAAWGATLEKFGALNRLPKGSRVYLDMVFCPPDRRRRDADNIIASLKASLDGISDALGIDDSKFVSTYSMGAPVKGGAVLVTVRSA